MNDLTHKIGVGERDETYKVNLEKWLSGELAFEKISYANFSSKMVMATIEIDKNNYIFVLIPKEAVDG